MSEVAEKTEDEVVEDVAVKEEEVFNSEDDDPMMVDMKEAEAEIAAAEAAEEAKADEAENEVADKADEIVKTETEEAKAADEGNKEETPMVPLARLNQVLSENSRLKENLTYTQGIVDTQSQMLPNQAKAGEEAEGGKAQEATDPASIIAKAETDKLELAQKYEDGDISFTEVQEQIVELDRSIRAQGDLQSQEVVRQAQAAAQNAVSANNVEADRSKAADVLEVQHPYVKAIDALPPAIANGIWDTIRQEATASLAEKGINPADGTAASDAALMQQMALLTDTYGPQYNLKVAEVSKEQTEKTGETSNSAKERLAKITMSEQQPPVARGSTADKRTELTEADIEKMSDDELADALDTAPQLIMKAAGMI